MDSFSPPMFNNLPLKKWCLEETILPFRMVNSHGLLLMVQKSGQPVEVCSLSHYLQGFTHLQRWTPNFWTINSMVNFAGVVFSFVNALWSLAPAPTDCNLFCEAKKEVKKQKAKKKRLGTWRWRFLNTRVCKGITSTWDIWRMQNIKGVMGLV